MKLHRIGTLFTLLTRARLHRIVRDWSNANGFTVHHKWEICWCGAQVIAEGSEAEVLHVCKKFRVRHRHTP